MCPGSKWSNAWKRHAIVNMVKRIPKTGSAYLGCIHDAMAGDS